MHTNIDFELELAAREIVEEEGERALACADIKAVVMNAQERDGRAYVNIEVKTFYREGHPLDEDEVLTEHAFIKFGEEWHLFATRKD